MDFNHMQTWHYFALIGGGVLVLGVILYFLPIGKMKIPEIITAAFGGLVAGVAFGIIFMAGFGYRPFAPEPVNQFDEAPTGPPPGPTAPMPKGKAGGRATPKGKGGFGAPPSSKMQLASLVAVLDRIVDKPVSVNLSPEDRSAIAKQLEGLDTANEIKEEDAKARLEAIQKVLEKDREALEKVGYRWPGTPRGGFAKGGFGKDPPANPFKQEPAAERLKSLNERLTKK